LVFLSHDPSPTDVSPLSLHDALPICLQVLQGGQWISHQNLLVGPGGAGRWCPRPSAARSVARGNVDHAVGGHAQVRTEVVGSLRSEEHTSELQSRFDLVCRLLLEKKK